MCVSLFCPSISIPSISASETVSPRSVSASAASSAAASAGVTLTKSASHASTMRFSVSNADCCSVCGSISSMDAALIANSDMMAQQDRNSDFEAQVVPKYGENSSQVEGKIIATYARGMSVSRASEQIKPSVHVRVP